MAVYAIGDVHGCHAQLLELLAAIGYRSGGGDRLWFVGDLINRGPESLAVLRTVMAMGDEAVVLMGNHEARALAGLAGTPGPVFREYMGYLLDAPDLDQIYAWLRGLPLWRQEPELGFAMTHAGIHPAWSFAEAGRRAARLHALLEDAEATRGLFANFGKGGLPETEPPPGEDPYLTPRFDLTVFTRIRFLNGAGNLVWPKQLRAMGEDPYRVPGPEASFQPWFVRYPWRVGERLVYGHWAAAGLTLRGPHYYGLDAGCVYGGRLSAMRLDHPELPVTQVACPQYVDPDED